MCPPNQVLQGHTEEENELFSFDFTSICVPTFFESLSHDVQVCGIPNDTINPAFPTIETEIKLKNEVNSSPLTSSDLDIAEYLFNDERGHERMGKIEETNTSFIVDDYWIQQEECTKAFVFAQSSLLEDAMSQNDINTKEDMESNGSTPCENDDKNHVLLSTKKIFLETKDNSNIETGILEAKYKMSPISMIMDSEISKPEFNDGSDTDDRDNGFENKRRRLMCKVCGDTASGYHYRVASCEACKAFFKRTVQGNIDYACPGSGNCKISLRGRKDCQACRFVKCINAGMLKEGVRTDRKRGGRQKYFRRTMISGQSTMFPNNGNEMSLENSNLLHSLKSCSLSSTRIAMSLLKVESMSSSQIWTVLAELFNRCIQDVIGGLNEVIGFLDFSLDDKICILRRSWCEVLTLKFVCFSATGESGLLKFAPNFFLTKAKAAECGMEGYYNLCLKAANRVSSLGGLHSDELLILQALILVNADSSIQQNKQNEELKNALLSLLSKHALTLSTSSPSSSILRVQNLLLLLPCIREAVVAMEGMWKELEGQIDPSNKLLIEMICR